MADSSRRQFLQFSGSIAGIGWSGLHWPALLALGQAACTARDSDEPLQNLERGLAADLAAIAAQIIPSGDTPGAREAGVIYFIDGALGSFLSGAKAFIEQGVAELNGAVAETDPGKRFAGLGLERQRQLLAQRDQTPFFSTMHFLTVAGMFAMPMHGGNRGHLGWELLGFDHTHGWQPPFGHYDIDEHGDD